MLGYIPVSMPRPHPITLCSLIIYPMSGRLWWIWLSLQSRPQLMDRYAAAFNSLRSTSPENFDKKIKVPKKSKKNRVYGNFQSANPVIHLLNSRLNR